MVGRSGRPGPTFTDPNYIMRGRAFRGSRGRRHERSLDILHLAARPRSPAGSGGRTRAVATSQVVTGCGAVLKLDDRILWKRRRHFPGASIFVSFVTGFRQLSSSHQVSRAPIKSAGDRDRRCSTSFLTVRWVVRAGFVFGCTGQARISIVSLGKDCELVKRFPQLHCGWTEILVLSHWLERRFASGLNSGTRTVPGGDEW
jgi:hypothetical protein